MPRGPKGEKRLADVIGNAVHVMRIATGEAEDAPKSGKVRGGRAGSKARAQAPPAGVRSCILTIMAYGRSSPLAATYSSRLTGTSSH